METTVKERLKNFVSYKKLNNSQFLKNCDLSTGFINSIKNSIQPRTLFKISKVYPDLNIGWLLTGEGDMLKEAEYEHSEINFIDSFHASSVEHSLSKNQIVEYYRLKIKMQKEEIHQLEELVRSINKNII